MARISKSQWMSNYVSGLDSLGAGLVTEDSRDRRVVLAPGRDAGEGEAEDVYAVLPWKMDDLLTKLHTLSNACLRVGSDPARVEGVGQRWDRVYDLVTGRPTDRFQRRVLVRVTGTDARLPGDWRFVAAIEHTEAGNLVTQPRSDDGAVPLEPRWQTAKPACDFCRTARLRGATYLVSEDGGETVKQVGGSCIAKYLGGTKPGDLAAMAGALRYLDGAGTLDPEERRAFGSDLGDWETGTYLAGCIARIERDGFVSRSAAYGSGRASTSELVLADLAGRSDDAPTITDAHAERGAEVREWARALGPEGLSDYLHNLRVAASGSGVGKKTAGILASAPSAWAREQARKAREAAPKPTLLPYGAGDKLGRKLTAADKRKGATAHPAPVVEVVFSKAIETMYGTSTILKFRVVAGPNTGAVLVWFRSGGDDGIKVGARGGLVATVKRTEGPEDPYGAATHINRAVFTPTTEE